MSHCIAFFLLCFRHMTTNCIIKAAADQSMIHHIEHCSKRKNEDSAYCHARAMEYFFHLGYFLASYDHRRYNHNRLEQLHCLERKKTEQPFSTWKSVDQALHYTDAFSGWRIFCRLLEIDRANVKYLRRTRNSARGRQELSCAFLRFTGRRLWKF